MGKIGNAEHTSIEMSPRRRNARARARRREERGWLAKNGPVTVRKLGEEPDEGGGLGLDLAGKCGVLLALVLGAALWGAPGVRADALGDAASLTGSTQAFVLGPSGFPDPGASFDAAVYSLYLAPLGYSGAADSVQTLVTPEAYNAASVDQGEAILISTLESDYQAGDFSSADPLTVFGYSQSATFESAAMPQLAADGIPTDALRFVMVGDPASAEGGFLNTFGETDFGRSVLDFLGYQKYVGETTPDNLYPTDVFTLNGDGWAQWDNGANIFGLGTIHDEYLGLTAAEIASATLTVDGVTDYYTIADPGNMLETLIAAAVAAYGI